MRNRATGKVIFYRHASCFLRAGPRALHAFWSCFGWYLIFRCYGHLQCRKQLEASSSEAQADGQLCSWVLGGM